MNMAHHCPDVLPVLLNILTLRRASELGCDAATCLSFAWPFVGVLSESVLS